MTLVDTAEMYGDGATEQLLGEALKGVRDRVFLVSKVYPQNAGRGRIEKACEASLAAIAKRHGVTPFSVALAWVLRDPTVIAIPKAGDLDHLKANRAALDLQLTNDDLAAIDAEFPPPSRKSRLAML